MLSNRNMGGKSQTIGSMPTVPVKIEIGRQIEFHALLETGERKPLSDRIKAIRPGGEMTIGNVWPTVPVIPSLKKRFTDQFFIPGIVID